MQYIICNMSAADVVTWWLLC